MDTEPTQFSMRCDRLPEFLADIDYHKIAIDAAASRDEKTILALCLFAYRLMKSAVNHRHPGLFIRASDIILTLYIQTIHCEALANGVGVWIDNHCLQPLRYMFQYGSGCVPREVTAQMPVLIQYLTWRLRLIKTAVEAGRTADAHNFQDRLFHRYDDLNEEPIVCEAYDQMCYSTLILAAFCLYYVETEPAHAESAKAIFDQCAGVFESREQLMRLWEAVRSKSIPGSPHDDRFYASRLIEKWPERTGTFEAYFISDAWIERGFIALLLTRPSVPKYANPTAFQLAPPIRPTAPDEVKAIANAILSNDIFRTGVLSISEDKRNECVDRVAALYADRFRSFKLERLARIVSAPLSEQKINRLCVQIAEKLETDRGFIDTLEKLGGHVDRAVAWFMQRATFEWPYRKVEYIASEEYMSDFGSSIAGILHDREYKQLSCAVTHLSRPVGTVQHLTDLPDVIGGAIERLRKATQNPLLVFVPWEKHIIEALIGMPAWQLADRQTFGNHHLGKWEGCELFRFPDLDQTSVVIVDALAFYGRVDQDSVSRLRLCIENPNKELHERLLENSQSESDHLKIPEPDTIKVLMQVWYALSVGLKDGSAAYRVELARALKS